MAHDRAAERDALALAARQLARLAVEQLLDAEDLGRLVAPACSISALSNFRIFRPNAMLS